jgi:hypothetical protein
MRHHNTAKDAMRIPARTAPPKGVKMEHSIGTLRAVFIPGKDCWNINVANSPVIVAVFDADLQCIQFTNHNRMWTLEEMNRLLELCSKCAR